jgi:hypothetical protein
MEIYGLKPQTSERRKKSYSIKLKSNERFDPNAIKDRKREGERKILARATKNICEIFNDCKNNFFVICLSSPEP